MVKWERRDFGASTDLLLNLKEGAIASRKSKDVTQENCGEEKSLGVVHLPGNRISPKSGKKRFSVEGKVNLIWEEKRNRTYHRKAQGVCIVEVRRNRPPEK